MTSVDELSGIPDEVMQRHKSNWANVDNTLNEKLTKPILQYDHSVDALKSAFLCIKTPEGKRFIDTYMQQMITILLQQSANRGEFEKNVILKSASLVLDILLQMPVEELFGRHIHTLATLLRADAPFYSDERSSGYYYSAPPIVKGHKIARLELIIRFLRAGGLSKLASLSSAQDKCVLWTGKRNALQIILKAIADTHGVTKDLIDEKETFVREVLRGLSELTEAEMKVTETSDCIASILESLKLICYCDVDISKPQFRLAQLYHPFWLSLICKLIFSEFLVLKLMAWDQMNALIIEAHRSKPRARSYIVSNAGLEWVNGCYNFSEYNAIDQSVKYTLETGRQDVPVLTMSRCKMERNGMWWFISQADKDNPGTNNDIDYYQKNVEQDKTGDADLEMTGPPLSGWGLSSTNKKPKEPAVLPAPTLEPLGILVNEGMTEEDFLVHRLKKYILSANLIPEVFGLNMHREVVTRCSKMLFFLAELQCITAEHLKFIWAASLKTDAECARGAIATLVSLCTKLSSDLYSGVINMAVESLSKPHTLEHLIRVSMLTDNLKPEILVILNRIAPERALELVWAIYNSPHFDSLKGVSTIMDLLHLCCRNSKTLVDKLQSCSAQIAAFASLKKVDKGEDASISRTLQQTSFLLSLEDVARDEGDVKRLASQGFGEILVEEVRRYVRYCDAKKVNADDRKIQLALRLEAICRFYRLCEDVNISADHVRALWDLLCLNPSDLEQMFFFLREGCYENFTRGVCSIFDGSDVNRLITSFVCSPSIDWSTCGDDAFSCLLICFDRVRHTDSEFTVMLETLWRATLNVCDDKNAQIVSTKLLRTYDDLALIDTKYEGKLLSVALDYLRSVQKEIAKSTSGELSSKSKTHAMRCISLLSMAIARSSDSTHPAHAVRGSTGRIKIVVKTQKATIWAAMSNSPESVHVDLSSGDTHDLSVHPMSSLASLKERASRIGRFGPQAKMLVDIQGLNLDLTSDHKSLASLGIVDDSFITFTGAAPYGAVNSFTSTHSSEAVNKRDSRFFPNLGQVIATDQDQFFCLMALCDDLSASCRELSDKIWDLLMLTPTQTSLELVVTDQENPNWADLLGAASARTAYILQIIDIALQPASELRDEDSEDNIAVFQVRFMSTGGFEHLLNVIATTDASVGGIRKTAIDVALQILRRLLKPSDEDWNSVHLEESHKVMSGMAFKLLKSLVVAASQAASVSASQTLENALATVTDLLESPDVALAVTSDAQCKILLATSLRSASSKVRATSKDFALRLGTKQPIVFSWLVDELERISGEGSTHEMVFEAVKALLIAFRANPQDIEVEKLATLLTDKLLAYPALVRSDSLSPDSNSETGTKLVLCGYLDLYSQLLELYPAVLLKDRMGYRVLSSLLSEYLFAVPKGTGDQAAICPTANDSTADSNRRDSRKLAFVVLHSLINLEKDSMSNVVDTVEGLLEKGNATNSKTWQRQLSSDMKRASIPFSGLKNQGCTCYLNSLLQQLFMCKPFREAILSCTLPESYRKCSLLHRSNEDLVGTKIIREIGSKSLKMAVLSWNPVTKKHVVKILDKDTPLMEVDVRSKISPSRIYDEAADAKVSKAELDSFRVLDQLQRTFCFLESSKKRFFDPRPLVDACSTLNMNYDVLSQNDVCEFFDQLSDRIETATKTEKIAGLDRNVWKDVVMKDIFNGKTLYQKVPRDCINFETDKSTCGHWQSARDEKAPKFELQVKNINDIDEALAAHFASELMDGDNKIQCDVCCEKKATLRRSVMGSVPNTMILHLKRFDIDMASGSFETIKLNNRVEFPLELNVLKYTKEGIEAEERRVARDAAEKEAHTPEHSPGGSPRTSAPNSPMPRKRSMSLQYELTVSEPNVDDYAFELQGVVVHAGIAGGGHYYSFARDADHPDKWYKFDDDEVTEFEYSSESIAYECFGGAQIAGKDLERSTNALMLFYAKKRRAVPASSPASNQEDLPGCFPDVGSLSLGAADNILPPKPPAKEEQGGVLVSPNPHNRLIDGRTAYLPEVQESNLQHVLSQYLHDTNLHSFVRSLLSMDAAGVNPERLLRFGLKFLLSTVLRCRDKLNMLEWIDAVDACFRRHPSTVWWFLNEVLSPNCLWLAEYVFSCPDSRASHIFSSILIKALRSFVPSAENGLSSFQNIKYDALFATCQKYQEDKVQTGKSKAALSACIAILIRDSLHTKVVNNCRHSLEVFSLLREMAEMPALRSLLVNTETISSLSYFVITEHAGPEVCARFKIETKCGQDGKMYKTVTTEDLRPAYPMVYEVIAALLGIPQPPKVPLLADRKGVWECSLTAPAKEAVKEIFLECSTAETMTEKQFRDYMEIVYDSQRKKLSLQSCSLTYIRLSRDSGYIRLKSFTQFLTEEALVDEGILWGHLSAFSFRNDLSRSDNLQDSGVIFPAIPLMTSVVLPERCRKCLESPYFPLVGIKDKFSPSAEAAVMQFCMYNIDVTMKYLFTFLQQITFGITSKKQRTEVYFASVNIVTLLLAIPDGNSVRIMREALLLDEVGIITGFDAYVRVDNYVAEEFWKLLETLYSVPSARVLMETLAPSEPRILKVLEMLRRAPPAEPELELENTICEVFGAYSFPEVNGMYEFKSMLHGAAWYQKRLQSGNFSLPIHLYKCKLSKGGFQWYISKTPYNCNPGTKDDTDLYSADCVDGVASMFPGADLRWESCEQGSYDCPHVTCRLIDADVNLDADSSLDRSFENDRSFSPASSPYNNIGRPRNGVRPNESDSDGSTKGHGEISSSDDDLDD